MSDWGAWLVIVGASGFIVGMWIGVAIGASIERER